MTRGLGGHSPSNVAAHLRGIQFPATKRDLLRQARENDPDQAVLEVIQAMPDEEFRTMADVMRAYSEADEHLMRDYDRGYSRGGGGYRGGPERDEGGRYASEGRRSRSQYEDGGGRYGGG